MATPVDLLGNPAGPSLALEFLRYAHKPDADYTGTVCFTITDGAQQLKQYVAVRPPAPGADGSTVDITAERPTDPALGCSVTVDKDTLIGMLAGTADPMLAIMGGQIVVDDLAHLMGFTKAFELSKAKFDEFQAANEKAHPEVDPSAPPASDLAAPAAGGAGGEPSDQTLEQKLARKSLMMILAGRQLTQQLNTKMDEFSNSESMVRRREQLRTTSAYQTLKQQWEKTPESFKEGLSKAVGTTSRIANNIGTGVVQSLTRAASETPEQKTQRRASEKADLQARLDELKQKNQDKKQQRKERLASSSGTTPPPAAIEAPPPSGN